MNTAQAGTLESMDCIVRVTEKEKDSGLSLSITGDGVLRFRTSMEERVKAVLSSLNVRDVDVQVVDHGALDIVLGARVETAIRRLRGEK